MNFWKKILADGTEEVGTDQDINLGKASWTRGRQDIKAAALSLNGKILILKRGIASDGWCQFDHCVAMRGRPPKVVARELRCRTLEYEFAYVSWTKADVMVELCQKASPPLVVAVPNQPLVISRSLSHVPLTSDGKTVTFVTEGDSYIKVPKDAKVLGVMIEADGNDATLLFHG